MKITWNPDFKQFETHARTTSLSLDVDILKSAGWKTEGPPEWRWIAFRSGPLIKLKKAIPVGITATPDVLANFNRLKEQDEKNAVVKKALKEAKAEQKEVGPEIDWDSIKPGKSELVVKYTPPKPTEFCSVCHEPVYFYECHEPVLLCLDCEFSEDF